MKKSLLFVLTPIAIGIAIGFASCKNTSTDVEQPPQTEYAQPVSYPLKFSKAKKIDWDSIKTVSVNPLVKKFDLNKLPTQSYDVTGFKPFKYPVEETKLDFNALPEKALDIDKIPSRPLKFKTEILPPPHLIKSGPPHLKNGALSLFQLGEAQGLPERSITCLFTDHEGFLWIATDKALYRYDGENLSSYIPVTRPHFIYSMVQDSLGRIWMGTWSGGGLEVFDPKDRTLKKTGKTMGLSSNHTNMLLQDKQQRIWFNSFSSGGINIIDPKTQTVKWLDRAYGLLDKVRGPSDTTGYGAISQDKNNNIWIATEGGVNMIDLKNKKIKYLDKANGLKSDSLTSVLCDQSGRVWIGLYGGLVNVLDIQKNSIQTIREAQAPKANISSFLQDNRGRVWIGEFNNAVTLIDPERQLARTLKKSDSLNSDQIVRLNQDSRGQVWIGTERGLNMISNNKAVIEHIGKARVDVLIEDKQGLAWDDLFNGIDIIDRKNKTARHLGVLQGLGNDTVIRINEINDKLFIVTYGGLDIIDPLRTTITHIGKDQGLNSMFLNGIAADKMGQIWMTERGGLCIYDPKTSTVKHIGKAIGYSNFFANNIQTDAKGNIWLNRFPGGIEVIDPNTRTIKHLNDNDVPGLKEPGFRLLLPDKKGNMWIGTNNGIYIADMENKTLTSFSVPQGLIDQRIATLLQRDGRIYASTVGGVTMITPPVEGIVTNKKWGAYSFGNEYGLYKVNDDYGNTDAISRDGYFLWGDYGVTILDLSKKDTFIPPPYIAGMNIMDQANLFTGRSRTVSNGMAWDEVSGPFNMPVNLQLPHDQNYVQFNYGSLNLSTHDTTWYRYKLVGKDTGWSAKNTATLSRNYFSLVPGKYTFEVTSKSSDNGWSKPATLGFTINPPWWQTWWAYILYVCLFAGTVWCFAYFRSLQLIKEKRVLENKVKIRTEEVIQQKEEIESQRDNLEVQKNSLEKTLKELKITQTQLIQSEKMASLGELTAGIAHEIQNPLNFVNNFSEVNKEMLGELETEIKNGNTADALALTADIIQNEEKINHHGKRADGIVKGMLEHSRSGSGQKEPTDLNVMADEFMRLSYHGLRAKDKSFNAELITHFDANLPKIEVVQQDIGRVLLNLFNNAFYAVNQKCKTAGPEYRPTVEITTFAPPSGGWGAKIKDNGVGIPDAIKEKIMQPFFTTKPTGEGTGLGLSLTYDMVVKGHGGNIAVDTKEGEFTEFIIQLPV